MRKFKKAPKKGKKLQKAQKQAEISKLKMSSTGPILERGTILEGGLFQRIYGSLHLSINANYIIYEKPQKSIKNEEKQAVKEVERKEKMMSLNLCVGA